MKKIWGKERCHEEALKYTTRNDFREKSPSAYNASLKKRWLNDICGHMQELKKPKEYWTKEKCHEEALKYECRSDFSKKSVSAYSKAWDFGWLDDICSHMIHIGNKYKRCIYVYEFSDGSAYIGLTFNAEDRKRQHSKKGPVFEHSKNFSFNFKLLVDYIDVNEAKSKEKQYFDMYMINGWKLLNIAKPGASGGGSRKWTKEKCHEESMKFNNIKDYRNNSLSYRAATRNKWLDDICKHMSRNKFHHGYWTYEKCREIISTLNKITDLYKKYPGAYQACMKNNWMDELCINLQKRKSKPSGYWSIEKCKEEALKYKTKKEFRENNISAYTISNKLKIMEEICRHMINQ